MNKKLLMLVLSFLIVCTQVVFPSVFVLADDADMAEYALRGREVLGAIGADQYINEDKNVTRLEFLSTLMAVMKLDSGSDGTSVFSDVPAASASVINSALDMGIISEGKEFFPNNPIIYRDALKMSLMAAGYEYQCAIAGGYPYGVISVADKKDLMNSIDLAHTDALTLDSAYALLYNLFNINIVTQTGFGDSMSFSEMDGETILTRYHDVYVIEGIVTGNSLTTLYAPRNESESFVEIDSVQYACDAKYEKLIGHNVVAFVKGKNAASKSAIALFSEKTELLSLNADEVTKNGNILSVMEDANTKNYKLSSLYDVIYNGKSYSGNLTTEFLNSCESLTLVSNDGDKSYDVVVLEDITYTLIDNVNYIERKIFTHATLGKNLDLSLSGIRYSIADANGNPLSIYQLQEGTLLSSIVSSDGLYVSITVCSETVAGAISEMDSQGNVTIDAVSYKLSDEFRAAFPNVGLGSKGLFYLDANGTVAMYEDRASFMAYGYIIASAPGAGIDPNHKVKILSDTGVIDICTFANKVVVDGEPKSGQDAYAKVKAIVDGTDTKLIKYSLNNENEITRIDTPSLADADDGCVQTDGLSYNNNLTMYDFTNDSSFSSFSYRVYGTMLWPKASLASAKVFVVPDHTDSVGINDVGNEKKYKVGSADACLSHEQSLSKNKVKIFNMDKYGGCEVVVYHQPPSEGVNFKTTSYNSAVLVNITNAIVNDEESRKLTVLMNGTFSEYVIDTDMVDEATLKDSGKALCPGDIIRFKADNGVISDLVVDFDADLNVMAKNEDTRTSISFNSTGATNIQYQSGKLYSISSSNALLTPEVGGRIDKRTYNYSFATLRNHDIPSSTMVKVSLADSANQEFSLFSVGNDGKISLSNGRNLGSVRDDAYTQIDMGYNAYVKRYFVRVNGKHIVSDYIAKTSFTNPASFNVKTFIGTGKSAIYFDEVKIYSGSEVRDDIKGAAYSDKSVEYVYVDTAKMEKPVFINNNFNTKAKAMNGLAVYNKDNVIEYMPLSDTEGCIVMDKTIDASDPFIDIALAGGVNSLDIVLEADVSSDKLGSTLYLFNVKSDEGISVNTFRVLPTGSITLYNGTVIGEVNKGEFTSVAAVYHFMEGTFDAYVNKKLVKENVAIGGKINAATTVRIQQMPSQGNGRILLDNIKMYDGKIPYTLTGETVDRYTVLPDDSEDINNLKGTVAFHDRGKYLFAKTQRLDLGVTPYYEGNTLMVSKDLIEKGFNLKVTENANGSVAIGDSIKLTIGSNQMTVGGKTHTLDAAPQMTENGLYLPVKNIAELALEKQYLHDDYGSVIISDMPFRHADNITVMKAISTYLIFPRLTYEKVDELFEASGYKNVHPRLFANAQDFENIKSYAKQDARVNEWMTSVIKEADSYIGTEPVFHYLQNNQMLECAHKIADRILACSFAYRITGDGKYANRAWIEMENCSVNFPNWNFQHFLDVGETTYAVAIGYDWCYDWMNDEQRAVVRNAIKYFGLEEGRKQYQGKPTGTYFVFQNMNWNAVCNGGLMAGACAIYEDEPESAKYTIINALRSLEYMMPEFAPDGAWVEGNSYWNYAMRFMVYMMESTKYTLGSKFDINAYTGVNRTASFIFGLDGNAGANGYHDAGSEHVLSPELMWLGTEFDDAGLVNAYLDRIDMMNVAGGMYHCLYYDPAYVGKASTQMPLDILSKGPEAGSMRSSWTDKNGMWLSYHGGKVVVNHYHVDKGTFVIDMLGERWATEIGGDGLSYTGNFNGARTDLYALRPEGHNCYIINPNEGPGQEMTGDCRVFRTESKPKGAIQVMDLTSVYVNDVKRAHRGFMLTDDRRTAVIRDEIDLLKDSEIYWFMHTDAEVEIVDQSKVILTKNGKRMQMDIICDGGTFEVKEMEEKPLPTSPVIEGQADKSAFTKIAIIVKGSGLVNISTRYTPADEYTADIPFVCGSIDSWTIPDGEVTPLPFANGVYADGKLLYNFDKDKYSYSVKVSAGESVPQITVDSGSYSMETLQTATKIGENSSFKLSDGNGKYSVVVVNIEERPSLEAVGGKKRLAPDEVYASSNPEAHNPDAHASDGNLTSRWAASGAQTLTCVYAEPVEVSAVAVAVMNWATRRYVFSIEVSQDGKNWTTIYSGNTKDGVEGYQTFEFTPVKTRYIRYSGSGNNENAWNTIAEFAVLK